nr:hypothetical protein [Tanacetum cinerariifolium]
MLKKIDKVLRHREQLKRLEEYFGGRLKTVSLRTFETLILDTRPALITDFCHGLGTFAYPYPTGLFDEVFQSHLARHNFEAQTFLEPILYLVGLAGLASTWEHALSSKKKCLITTAFKEGATMIKLFAAASSSKHESKKRKQEVSRRTSVRGSIPPPTPNSPKGIRKHPWVLARHMGSLEGGSDSLVPGILRYPSLKNRLGSLSLDDLAIAYDVHALPLALFGNMLTNKCRVVSRDYSKLKDDFVSLRSKNGLLEQEMLNPLGVVNVRCWDLEAKRDFLLSKESGEIVALFTKLKIADLEWVELALDEVHGLVDSLDFKDVEDYHPEAEKIYDEATESFYKLEFPYISPLVEKAGQSLGELATVDPHVTQEPTS